MEFSSKIYTAVTRGDREEIGKLIDAGKLPTGSNERGQTLLHLACAFAQPLVVSDLLETGDFSIEERTASGDTPLCLAATIDGLMHLQTLAARTARDYAQKDKNGDHLRRATSDYRAATCVKLLLGHGSKVKSQQELELLINTASNLGLQSVVAVLKSVNDEQPETLSSYDTPVLNIGFEGETFTLLDELTRDHHKIIEKIYITLDLEGKFRCFIPGSSIGIGGRRESKTAAIKAFRKLVMEELPDPTMYGTPTPEIIFENEV